LFFIKVILPIEDSNIHQAVLCYNKTPISRLANKVIDRLQQHQPIHHTAKSENGICLIMFIEFKFISIIMIINGKRRLPA